MVHVVSGILMVMVSAQQPAKTAPVPPEGVHVIAGHVVSVTGGVLTIHVVDSGEEMKLAVNFDSQFVIADKTGAKVAAKKSTSKGLVKGQLVHLIAYSDGKALSVLTGTVEGAALSATADVVGPLVKKLGGVYRKMDGATGKAKFELDLTGKKVTDTDLAPLEKAKDVARVKLSATGITDAGVAHVAAIAGLEDIDLSETKITDAGLEKLVAVAKGLKGLNLANTAITDKGVSHLAKAASMQSIDLSGTQITDAGVDTLAALPMLTSVYVSKTKVTDKAVQKLVENHKGYLRLCRVARGDKGQFQVHEEYRGGVPFQRDLLIAGVTYGFQYQASDVKKAALNIRTPTAYYHKDGPLGQVIGRFDPNMTTGPLSWLINRAWPEPAIGVLRMTAGTVAAYARPGQQIDFYNSTPEIESFSVPAKDQQVLFSFIADAKARGSVVKVIDGEERSTLAKKGPKKHYGFLVVEMTKNGLNEVNTNFLTKEAIKDFMDSVSEKGVLCLHITHRDYKLTAPLADAAKDLGFACKHGSGAWGDAEIPGLYSSEWVVIARKGAYLDYLKDTKFNYWTVPAADGKHLWKDGSKHELETLRK